MKEDEGTILPPPFGEKATKATGREGIESQTYDTLPYLRKVVLNLSLPTAESRMIMAR